MIRYRGVLTLGIEDFRNLGWSFNWCNNYVIINILHTSSRVSLMCREVTHTGNIFMIYFLYL